MRKWLENQGKTLTIPEKNQITVGSGKQIVMHSSWNCGETNKHCLPCVLKWRGFPEFPTVTKAVGTGHPLYGIVAPNPVVVAACVGM